MTEYDSSYCFVAPRYSDAVYASESEELPEADTGQKTVKVGRIAIKKVKIDPSKVQKALDEEQARMQKLVDDYLNDRE